MSFRLKHLFSVLAIGSGITALVYGWGLSDEKGSRQILEDNKFQVVRYDGHALLNRRHGEMFNDKYKVIDSTGRTREVVVAQSFTKATYQIRSEMTPCKDQPPLPPYNPFKIPSY